MDELKKKCKKMEENRETQKNEILAHEQNVKKSDWKH